MAFNWSTISTMTKAVLSGFCSLSFLLVPSQAEAYGNDCCAPRECCEQECCSSGWGNSAWVLGGAVVAGAVAGYFAGNSNKKHHGGSSSGSTGPVGPTGATGATGATGPSPFIADDGESLGFTFDIAVGAGLLNGATIIPFVTAPNGEVFTGAAILVGTSAIADTVTILVPDPVFGNYTAGLQVNTVSGGAALGGAAVATITATASRDGTTSLDLVTVTVLLAALGDQAQSSVDFAYSPSPSSNGGPAVP